MVGRYEVVDRIGSGGMGVVYAAEDPDLGRDVALKLLRPSRSNDVSVTEARGRLLREAQAMARLSHPNVLPVYDVGMLGDHVFVAMELVQGHTLAQWRKLQERTVQEVIETLAAAGQGLAAAHAADLVHRDFKPSNILVGEDGRVHVMDFGLARATGDQSWASGVSGGMATERLDDDLTRTGFVMGTPAYMSPEQHHGDVPDPRSDQWSFCVTLFESLYDRRPFRGANRAELVDAVLDGTRIPARGAHHAVPAHVRAVLKRGLSVSPGARFASMDALLRALTRPHAPRLARWSAWGVGGSAVLGATAWAGYGVTQAAPCHDVDAPVDAVWNDAARAAIAQRFAATDVSWASETQARTERLLDAYAQDWSTMRVQACEATQLRAAQDDAVLDLRMACLDRRLAAMARVVSLLGEAERTTVDHAVQTVAGLAPVVECADVAALQTGRALPTDPDIRDEVRAVTQALDRADVLRRSALFDEALQLAESTLPRAKAVEHPPLVVRAEALVGRLQTETGNVDVGLAGLERALWLAVEHGLDRTVARLSIHLVHACVSHRRSAEELQRWTELAQAKVGLLQSDGRLQAELMSRLGDAADVQGDYTRAQAYAVQALPLWAELAPNSYEHATAIANLGKTHFRKAQWADAADVFTEAGTMMVATLGANHPESVKLRGNIAVAAHAAGQYARARDEQEAILPRFIEIFGPEHPSVALTLTNLGNAYHRLGEHERALTTAERALSMKRRLYDDGQNVAISLNNVAMILLAMKRHDDAAARYVEAIEMLSVAMGPSHPALAKSLEGLAEVRHAQGDLADAETLLRRATQLEGEGGTPDSSRAVPTFLLARVLWERGSRAEANTLAAQANAWATAAAGGDKAMDSLARGSATWLAAHPMP